MVKSIEIKGPKCRKDSPFVEGVRFWRGLWEGEYGE